MKWRESAPVDEKDVAALVHARAAVPGAAAAALFAVTRSGGSSENLAAVLTPDDLLRGSRSLEG